MGLASPSPSVAASHLSGLLRWGIPTVVVLLVALARGWLQFSTEWVPGMNGAYYLVQARALLERGGLGIPDLPLTFVLHATAAKALEILTGWELQRCILLTVKTLDSLLPALLVLPLATLLRRYSTTAQTQSGRWLPWLVGLAVALSPVLLSMVGDFQKNSLGIVWLACLAWRLHEWMLAPTRRNGWLALLALGLVGVTHIAVFGGGLLLTVGTLLSYWLLHRLRIGQCSAAAAGADSRPGQTASWWFYLGALVVIAAAGTVVFWWFDPARVERLLGALSDPLEFLGGEGRERGGMPPRGGPGMGGPGGPGGPGGMGGRGPGMGGSWWWLTTAGFAATAFASLGVAWASRARTTRAELASIIGLALLTIAITGPWVQGDKANRLQMLAMAPAGLCTGYWLAAVPWAAARGLLAVTLLGGSVWLSTPRLLAGGRPILAPSAMRELMSLADSVEEPEQTLVSVQHGAEWWTAWYWHTRIAQGRALEPEDWEKYRYVWFMEIEGGMQPPMMPGMPGNHPMMMPPGPRPSPEDRPGNGPPRGQDFEGRPGQPGRRGPGGGGGPMGAMSIPADAEILFEGEHIKLGWAASVPDSVRFKPQK